MKKCLLVLLVCCGIYILSMFHRTSLAVLSMDIMRDFHFSQASLGLISGLTLFAYGLMQLPSGILADHIGAKRTLAVLTLLTGVSAFLFTCTDILPLSLGSRFCMGIGIAVAVPGYALLAQWYSPESYARAAGIMTASGAVGIVLSGPVLALLRDGLGWTLSLQLFAVLTLVMLLPILFGIPSRAPLQREERPRPSLRSIYDDLAAILSSSRFWLVSMWGMLTIGTFFTMSALWWVPYLVDCAGFSVMSASCVLFCAALTQLAAGPIIGWLSDVIFKGRRTLLIMAGSVCLLSFGAITLTTGSLPQWLLISLCMIWAFAASSGGILYVTILRENFPTRVGTAIGCSNLLYPVWSAVQQSIFGSLIGFGPEHSPYLVPMLFLTANVALGLLFALFVRESWGGASLAVEHRPEAVPGGASLTTDN